MTRERLLGGVVVGLCVLAAGACGSDDEGGGSGGTATGGSAGVSAGGSGGATGGTAGGGGATGGTAGSGGATGGTAGSGGTAGDATVEAATCDPAPLPDAWTAPSYKPVKSPTSACTDNMIKDYSTKCSGTDAPPCAAFQADGDAALTACESCLWSKESDSSWGALIQGTSSSMLNVAGCYELLGGEGAAECATAYYQHQACRAEVCQACTGGAVPGCETSADATTCKTYADASQTACQPFASSDCAGGNQKSKQALFSAVCGAAGDGGPNDGGLDAADASTD